MTKKLIFVLVSLLVLTSLLVSCAPAAAEKVVETVVVEKEVVVTAQAPAAEAPPAEKKVWDIYTLVSTPAEEPWISVMTAAAQKLVEEGRITWGYTDNLGYAGDFERVMRELMESGKYDALIIEGFGNEEAVRRAYLDYPDVPVIAGSGAGPVEPKFGVFDNWIHEPGYLLGMLAAGMTKTNKIGVVGGYPVPEVNRITNAFIMGVKENNPDATVYVQFINSWFDPPVAKETAITMIDNGVDVLYAERFGVIEAAVERNVWALGQMTDQHELGPDNVLSSSVWNLTPTYSYFIDQLDAGVWTAQDLKDFSMMAKGGASMAPYYNLEEKIPAELREAIEKKKADILTGVYRVNVDENQPAAVN